MRNLRQLICVAASVLSCTAANATCYGSGSFQTCSDNSGNNYNVQRYGSTTQVQGTNAQTGSSWNQTTQTMGNTTYHQGTAANGASWSGTSQHMGGTTFHQGTDSRGHSYSKTCTAAGCF